MAINYSIKQIDSKTANRLTIENHYLHRKASTMFAYGLFDGEEMLGTVIYGKPASPALCKGVCGADEANKVIELTRLWIKDGTPKNTESYLIGRSLKLLPKDYDIIVSYAEIGAGHIGVVYQATNWIYTGLSDKHIQWVLKDNESAKHARHLFDAVGGVAKAKELYGDLLEGVERPRKHRYIFFNSATKSRKKELLSKLRYPVQPYPKKEN